MYILLPKSTIKFEYIPELCFNLDLRIYFRKRRLDLTKTNTTQNRKPKIFYGYIIVAATFLILIAMIGAVMTFGVFLNPMSEEFNWGYATLSGAMSTSILVSGFLGILAGRLSDRFGPKKLS